MKYSHNNWTKNMGRSLYITHLYKMGSGGLAKLVAILLFGMATICYSATIKTKTPFNKTLLYKYMVQKYGTIPKAQKSPELKKQTAEKKTLSKPSFKSEDKLTDKTVHSPTYRQAHKLPSANEQLDEIVDLSNLTHDMPFGEAINILRDSTKPKLNIVVLWRNLEENADINRDTPIGIDGISRIPLHTGLKLLLYSISTTGLEKLDYVVDENLITIATEDYSAEPVTKVYYVSVFSGAPANFYTPLTDVQFFGGGRGGSSGSGRGSGGGSDR